MGWGKEVFNGLRWNGYRDGRKIKKSSVIVMKGEKNFRRVELINSENCFKEINIRYLVDWRRFLYELV